jgi:hypothetical protein
MLIFTFIYFILTFQSILAYIFVELLASLVSSNAKGYKQRKEVHGLSATGGSAYPAKRDQKHGGHELTRISFKN